MKKYLNCDVLYNEQIADGIYDMRIEASEITESAIAGQFVNLFTESGDKLLPRPISICETDREMGILRIVYRIAGKGTLEFSKLKPCDTVKVIGPLGNGFTLEESPAAVVGGGIGIPPLLGLASEIAVNYPNAEITAFLGYRNAETFLSRDFAKYCKAVEIATDDGSAGVAGNCVDLLKASENIYKTVYACGPLPMLKALSNWAAEKGVRLYVSLEERMACGVGACIGCAVKTKAENADTGAGFAYKKVCSDGPVFLASEVIFG